MDRLKRLSGGTGEENVRGHCRAILVCSGGGLDSPVHIYLQPPRAKPTIQVSERFKRPETLWVLMCAKTKQFVLDWTPIEQNF
jgi:hypothetical protein